MPEAAILKDSWWQIPATWALMLTAGQICRGLARDGFFDLGEIYQPDAVGVTQRSGGVGYRRYAAVGHCR